VIIAAAVGAIGLVVPGTNVSVIGRAVVGSTVPVTEGAVPAATGGGVDGFEVPP